MRAFTRDATRLAFVRQRMLAGRSTAAPKYDEAELLDALMSDRRALASAAGGRPLA
jgi:hypothetical protein